MNRNNKYLMMAGIAVGAAALLYYPAMKLYQMIQQRRLGANDQEETKTNKSFAPNYLGNHKPHHRKAESDGQLQGAHA